MKKIILMMMCLAIAMTSYSKKEEELKVSGFFVSTSNVKFEVAIVNNDASRVVIQTKSNIFSYKIALKLGNEYVVTFMKDGVIKELFITADKPGTMEVDVDFKTESAAQLCYNKKEDDYNLTLLYTSE